MNHDIKCMAYNNCEIIVRLTHKLEAGVAKKQSERT